MRYITLVLILSLFGCATNSYTVNGVEPKEDNSTLKIIGAIAVTAIIAKGLANKNCQTPQTIRNSNGTIVGTVGNC